LSLHPRGLETVGSVIAGKTTAGTSHRRPPAVSRALQSIYEDWRPARPAFRSRACPRSVPGPGCGARAAGQSRHPPPYQPEQQERLLRHQCPEQRASEIHTDQASVAEWAPKLIADSKAATRAMSMHSCLRRSDRGRRRFVGGGVIFKVVPVGARSDAWRGQALTLRRFRSRGAPTQPSPASVRGGKAGGDTYAGAGPRLRR